MKKIYLFILAIFAITCTYGQAGAGLKTGLNLANVKFGQDRRNSRIGWYAGGLVEFNVSDKMLVRTELLYSIKGYAFPATIYNNKGTLSLIYCNLPVLFGYRANDQLSIFLGPEIGYLLQARSKSSNVGRVDVTQSYRRFDKGIDLGLAYHLNKKLGAELRYNYGFKGLQYAIYTDPNGNQTGQDRTGENRVLQLGVYCKL